MAQLDNDNLIPFVSICLERSISMYMINHANAKAQRLRISRCLVLSFKPLSYFVLSVEPILIAFI